MLPRRASAFDADHLARQTFGDPDLQGELLRLFRAQCRILLPAIAGRAGEKARHDAAHKLKGAARAVGAVRIAALSDALENGLGPRGRSDASADRLVRDLRVAIAEARRALREDVDA